MDGILLSTSPIITTYVRDGSTGAGWLADLSGRSGRSRAASKLTVDTSVIGQAVAR
jgi:hypothetical protein